MRDDKERILFVANATLLVFVLAAGLVRYSGRSAPSSGGATPVPPRAAKQSTMPSISTERMMRTWYGGSGLPTSTVAAALEIPDIPGGKLMWHTDVPGRGYWGYLTPSDGTDIGIAALKYYSQRQGWNVVFSEQMDTEGRGWTGVLIKPQQKVVIGIFAIPESLGLPSKQTRVSIVRFNAEGVQRLADSYLQAKH